MEILALVGVGLVLMAAFWLISMPFRRINQENTFERMLKDPEVQDLLYIAVARAHQRRKKAAVIAQQTATARLSNTPPRGRIARLLWEAEKEGERVKRNALEELYSESD